VGNVERLTDSSLYTGSHKDRFDEEGKGKGLEGHDSGSKGKGQMLTSFPNPSILRDRRKSCNQGERKVTKQIVRQVSSVSVLFEHIAVYSNCLLLVNSFAAE